MPMFLAPPGLQIKVDRIEGRRVVATQEPACPDATVLRVLSRSEADWEREEALCTAVHSLRPNLEETSGADDQSDAATVKHDDLKVSKVVWQSQSRWSQNASRSKTSSHDLWYDHLTQGKKGQSQDRLVHCRVAANDRRAIIPIFDGYIMSVKGDAFVSAFLGSVMAHQAVYEKNRVLHGDIHPYNMVYQICRQTETVSGCLLLPGDFINEDEQGDNARRNEMLWIGKMAQKLGRDSTSPWVASLAKTFFALPPPRQ